MPAVTKLKNTKKATFYLLIIVLMPFLSGCVVMPIKDHGYVNQCEISTDRKYLKIVDMAKGTNSYYSISGVILLPISGIVSGAYVGVNNIYHLGEEAIRCESTAEQAKKVVAS